MKIHSFDENSFQAKFFSIFKTKKISSETTEDANQFKVHIMQFCHYKITFLYVKFRFFLQFIFISYKYPLLLLYRCLNLPSVSFTVLIQIFTGGSKIHPQLRIDAKIIVNITINCDNFLKILKYSSYHH